MGICTEHIDQRFHATNNHDVIPRLPHRPTRLIPPSHEMDSIAVPHTEYADDLMYPLNHKDPKALLQA
eukprot:4008085-Amphidinium_carterae.1